MIKINLLDYGEEVRKVQIQKRTIRAAFIVLLWIVAIIFVWTMEQQKILGLKSETLELERQAKSLEPRVTAVKEMQKKVERLTHIVTGIQGLRDGQSQPARLLDDLNQWVPAGVWLNHIIQIDKVELRKQGRKINFEGGSNDVFEIKGMAFDNRSIAQYIEGLEKIPYFKSVILYSSEQKFVDATPVWRFFIFCHKA